MSDPNHPSQDSHHGRVMARHRRLHEHLARHRPAPVPDARPANPMPNRPPEQSDGRPA